MKIETSPAITPFKPVTPLPTPPANIIDCMPLPDIFKPAPVKPPHGDLPDIAFQFGLSRKGSEDLSADKAKQEARAQEALRQVPPDLKTFVDANKKIDAIEAEQGRRTMEQRGFEVGLRFKDDKALEKELSKAERELEQAMNNPLASEADRERARARLSAVVAELDRRD